MTPNRPPALPGPEQRRDALPSRLAPLAEAARDYARAATSQNTNRAYAADWRHYNAWVSPAKPPCPAPGSASSRPLHRRLRLRRGRAEAVLGRHHRAAALGAHVEFRPARRARSTARTGTSPPCWRGSAAPKGARLEQKEAILPEDLMAMIATFESR